MMNLALGLLVLALPALAHEGYPIRPVRVSLSVEKDRIAADIETDSIFWIEEVAHLHPMPAADWPVEVRGRVQDYVNAHMRLSAGGRILPGTLATYRYRQLPWEVNEEGVFFLRLLYPPAPAGGSLTVATSFFEEYRAEIAAEYGGRPPPYAGDYRTLLSVPGTKPVNAVLTETSPAATVSVDGARRSLAAAAAESAACGVRAALGAAAGFPLVIAAVLCLESDPSPRRSLIVALVSAAWGFAGGALLASPPALIWGATLAASLAIGRRAAAGFGATACACLGLAWHAAARPELPHAALALPSALVGALAGGSLLFLAARLGVRAERARLTETSEFWAEELFRRRARLASTMLSMIGAYGLWQSLQG